MSQTILIIDHKPGPIRRARSVLERAGYRVEVARDGAAGLSAYQRLSPGLTLIGEALPDRKGPTVCKELKSSSHGSPAPILMIGCHRDQDRDQLGCDEYLISPVADDDLLEAVRRHLRESDSDRPAKTVSGDLEHLNIAEIVQTLSLGMKTACITLRSSDSHGKIWFEKGKVHHATTGDLDGEPAFFEMMAWTSGEFSIENGATFPERTIARDTMFLVMEGLRRVDEASEAASRSAQDQQDQQAKVEAEAETDSADAAEAAELIDDIAAIAEEVSRAEPEEEAVPDGPSNQTQAQPESRADSPEPVRSVVADPAPPARNPVTESSRTWAIAAVCLALLGFGIHSATKALWQSESATTVPVPIRIGPAPESDAGPTELVAAADVDEIWSGYDLVEYPESPIVGPAIEEAHTEWGVLDERPDDPSMTSPVETAVDHGPGASDTDPESETTAEPAPDTESGEALPAASASEVPVEDPPKVDYSLGLAAADEILAQMADPNPGSALDAPLPVEPSSIDLFVTSSVRQGTLTVLVDDSEVLTRELASPRRSRQSFDTSLSIESGEHRVVARLDLANEGYSYENSVVVEVEAGETVELELSAGRSGRRPIILTLR